MDRLSRRQFVQGAGMAGLGLLAGCGRLPGQAAGPAQVHRIGILSLGLGPDSPVAQAFAQGLREVGYTEGQNILVEYRNAEGQYARLPQLASELAREPVEVIFVAGGVEPAQAVKNATTTLPIVFTMSADPVRAGIVASLAAPGGNATGLTSMNTQLDEKRLELLHDSCPGATRFAVLSNPSDPDASPIVAAMEHAARSLGVTLQVVEARAPREFDSAFAAATQAGTGALAVQGNPLFFLYYRQLVELAAQSRLPMITAWREAPEAGGVMSYGTSLPAMFHRAAYYVGRILKGAKAADLPVEQPREFDFVINLKTAQALGLTIPEHVLLQATEVIQ
jgi:putative ABC transport system substrate-binding protein